MTITTRVYTFFSGTLVGTDAFGNRYYRRTGRTHGESSISDNRKHETRWVLYKTIGLPWWKWALVVPALAANRLDLAEPSKVPPEWHGWLHYTQALPPIEQNIPPHGWQKPHLPNLTGTKNAYMPLGHVLKGAQRERTTADYEPWQP